VGFKAQDLWRQAKDRGVLGKVAFTAVAFGVVAFGSTDFDVWVVASLACLIASFFVSHAYAVRISRALESRGRFRARSAVGFWSGSLMLVNIALVLAVCDALGIPVVEPGLVGAADTAISGTLALACAFATGVAVLAVARALPARGRSGPHRPVNAAVGVLAHLLARAGTPIIMGVFGVAWFTGLSTNQPGDVWGWVLVVVLVPASCWIALMLGQWTRWSMSSYAERLRSDAASDEGHGGGTLYLRPFAEENRLFAGSETFEQFIQGEIGHRVGPLVALGNPTDRIAPAGAKRRYQRDDDWQASVERYAKNATCIVGVTAASTNTAWELTRIRELGLESRLFLLSPPIRDEPMEGPATNASLTPIPRMLRFVRQLVNAYVNGDTAKMTHLLAFGKLPAAWSPTGLTAWPDFVNALAKSGYVVSVEDPGDGAVLGFDPDGVAVVLAQNLRTPGDYVNVIASRLSEITDGERAALDTPRDN
jgi:hypothetical protein